MRIEDIRNPAAYNDIRYFEKATKEAFKFLVMQYGYEELESICAGPECLVEYRNKTTAVQITWEWPYYIVVELARLEAAPDGIRSAESHDLEHLLTIRASEKHLTQTKHPSNDELKRVLDTYASLTREYAGDILSGDFSVFPKLMVLSLASIERKKHMLGYPKS